MELTVMTLNGGRHTIDVEPDATVLTLAERISERTGIPSDMMRLLYSGQELQLDQELSSYGVLPGSSIHLVLKLARIGAASAAPAPRPTPVIQKDENVEKCWSAAYTEEWEKARSFLDSGAVTLDRLEVRTSRPLLLFFSERGMVEAVQYLIEKRGKPATAQVRSALNAAILKRKRNMVQYFLNSVVTIAELEADAGQVQPLHCAMINSDLELVDNLLALGADPNYFATHGGEGTPEVPGTPLMTVAATAYRTNDRMKDCIRRLLSDPRANPNFANPTTGDTALHSLTRARFADADMAVELLENGVDPTIVNAEGKRAEDYVSDSGHSKTDAAIRRAFKMAKNGKIKPRKRGAEEQSSSSDTAGGNKRIRTVADGPVFHTLDAASSRLNEWTRKLGVTEEDDDDTGSQRDDGGKSPLYDAIQQDLQQLAAGNDALSAAARVALDFAATLRGVTLGSETESAWIPFLVDVPPQRTRRVPVMKTIAQAIRAPKAKLTDRDISKNDLTDFFAVAESDDEGDDEDEDEDEEEEEEEDRPKVTAEAVWNFVQQANLQNFTAVRFPEEAVCYPVFRAGAVTVDGNRQAVVGVFAVRVDT